MTVMIYHNSDCDTSRSALKLIREAGIEPAIIDYMAAPPSHEEMLTLLLAMDMAPRQLLRTKEPVYLSLKLDDESKTADYRRDAGPSRIDREADRGDGKRRNTLSSDDEGPRTPVVCNTAVSSRTAAPLPGAPLQA